MLTQAMVNTIVPVLRQHGIVKASVFGSFVRNEETQNSDVDILIQSPSGMTLFDLAGLYCDLEEKLHRRVDLVEYGHIKKSLRDSILNDKMDIL